MSSMIDTLASRLSCGLVCMSKEQGARMPVSVVRETRTEGGFVARVTIDRAALERVTVARENRRVAA